MSHHGVKLMEGIADLLHLLSSHHHFYCQVVNIARVSRNKLMERGVKETDGHRPAFHRFINSLEVTLLVRDQVV
ncbi:hypothetical protein IMSAGC019_03726 [Lachnospiraceae bacterium]|nr:hypothetical protein IMSAGC019_03726 [Lachnospiraceae bacterium]